MFRCTHGEVFYRDHNLTIDDDSELTRYRREHVGFVFQFYNLIASLTALENVELVTDIAENPMRPEEALALVGLKKDFIQGFLKKYPHYCVKLRSRMTGIVETRRN